MKVQQIAIVAMLLFPAVCFGKGRNYNGDVQVDGYYRSNGTYVAPYTRSQPNAYNWDNHSYTPSQPAYNNSYYQPTKTYGSEWTTPAPSRLQDNNPYNDSPNTTGSNDYNYLNR